MRKKIYFSLCMVVALALVVLIPCLIDNSFLATSANMAIYLTAKIIFGLWLIAAWLMILFKPMSNTTGTIILAIAGFAQLVPLALRFILPVSGGLLWAIIVFAVVLLIVLALTGMLMASNKKMVESDKKYEGKSIEVKDDSKMYDENNRFKGISKE